MLKLQAEFKELIENGKFIEEYIGKEILREVQKIVEVMLEKDAREQERQ